GAGTCGAHGPPSVAGDRGPVVGARWSALGGRRSVVGGRRSAVGGRRAVIGDRWPAVGARRSALGGRWPVAGGRPSAVGGRRSAVGGSSGNTAFICGQWTGNRPLSGFGHQRGAPGARRGSTRTSAQTTPKDVDRELQGRVHLDRR